jgi:hypothetical protein
MQVGSRPNRALDGMSDGQQPRNRYDHNDGAGRRIEDRVFSSRPRSSQLAQSQRGKHDAAHV